MRIVLISTPIGFLGSGKGGGVELTLNSLVSGLISLGHSVEVVAPKNSKLHENNVEVKLHFVEGEDQISWQHQNYKSKQIQSVLTLYQLGKSKRLMKFINKLFNKSWI